MSNIRTITITAALALTFAACVADELDPEPVADTGTGTDGGEPLPSLCCPVMQDGSVDGCACRLAAEQTCDPDNEAPGWCPGDEQPVQLGDHWGCAALAGSCEQLTDEPGLDIEAEQPEQAPVDDCSGSFCCDACDPHDQGCSGCGPKIKACSGTILSCDAGSCYNGGYACGNPAQPWTANCCN